MLILPTKMFKIEYQPDGKTIFKLEYRIPNPKRISAATPDEAKEMLYAVMRFESRLTDIKRILMEAAGV